MAKVYITEYQGTLVLIGNNAGVAMGPEIVNQSPITSSGTSQPSAAMNAATNLIRIHTDGIISISIGTNPTASTSTARMAANQTEYFGVAAGQGIKVAVITNT